MQGDREASLGLPISAFMDRRSPQVQTCQIGFINVLVKPLYVEWHKLLGETVQEAIDGILVPFFRAYGEAFERFQKAASVEAPCMADAWAAEKPQPTIQAFLTLVAQAEAVAAAGGTQAATNSTSDAVSATKLRELENRVNRKLESLTSKTQKLSKAMSDAESEDEESPSAKTLANRAKKQAKKDRQQAAKAAREGAASNGAAKKDGQ